MANVSAVRAKRFPGWRLCLAGLGGFAALVGLGLLMLVLSARLPSDRSVVENFQRNKPVYEKLRSMMEEDSKIRSVDHFGVVPENGFFSVSASEAGLDETRFRQYVKMLKQAKISGVYRDENGLRFAIGGWGWGIHGWRLAIAYRPSPPEKMVFRRLDFDSANALPVGETKWRQAYRPIEGPWYIWLIW